MLFHCAAQGIRRACKYRYVGRCCRIRLNVTPAQVVQLAYIRRPGPLEVSDMSSASLEGFVGGTEPMQQMCSLLLGVLLLPLLFVCFRTRLMQAFIKMQSSRGRLRRDLLR